MSHAAGSSKALRGATNRLAKKLGRKPKHTGLPRADFDRMLNGVRDPKKIAAHYYKMGLRRGLIRATDYTLDGTFKLNADDELETAPIITVRVRLGLPGQAAQPQTFQFKAKDLGRSDDLAI